MFPVLVPVSPPLLRDHVSLPLQRLLQALDLQQQLVHGHVMLLPLLLQLALRHLQRLGLAAQPERTGRAEPLAVPNVLGAAVPNVLGAARLVLLLQDLTLPLALVQAALPLVEFRQEGRGLGFQGLAVFRQLRSNKSKNDSGSSSSTNSTEGRRRSYLSTVLVLLLEERLGSVALGGVLLEAVQLLLQLPVPAHTPPQKLCELFLRLVPAASLTRDDGVPEVWDHVLPSALCDMMAEWSGIALKVQCVIFRGFEEKQRHQVVGG